MSLSDKIVYFGSQRDGEEACLWIGSVKKFIKDQVDRIDLRIDELSEFCGLRVELEKVGKDLITEAGDKLI